MSRNILKYSVVAASLLVTALVAGCGASNKEGNINLGSVAKVPETMCKVCHAITIDPLSGRAIVQGYIASPHNKDEAGCQGCHGGGAQHNGVGPIPFPNPADRCSVCHEGTTVTTAVGVNVVTFDNSETIQAQHLGTFLPATGGPGNCGTCHNPHAPLNAPFVGGSCVACHAFAQNETDKADNNGGGYVNDNNGVRAITGEFAKWSHHVTGVTLNDAHCAACHLEGKVTTDGKIAVDTTKHMADARVHLRNADNDSDFTWDPAEPNHSNMDNFCMSCHDANGATSATNVKIQAFINSNHLAAANKTASASNPFGDTISNKYDKMQRPAVVDASSQFNTANNSHHAVKGPRYSGRTRVANDPRVITKVDPDSVAGTKLGFALNSSATLQGKRSTIYDAGNFNALYTPLGTAYARPANVATSLGDDSTLHCGDCHTVGQWKAGVATNAAGYLNTIAIGAHGSNNEYLLRNSIGSDARHTQNAYLLGDATGTVKNPATGVAIPNGVVLSTNPDGAFLVCYNCHAFMKYGSAFAGTGVNGPHAGEYANTGKCNGPGNTLPFNGYTTGNATDGTKFASRVTANLNVNTVAAGYPGEQNGTFAKNAPTASSYTESMNIFGIQCANCHNSGLGNGYGGIHGSAKNTGTTDPSILGGAYIDGMGNTNKVERFLPGLGNAMHVPGTLGGVTNGTVAGPVTNSTFVYTYATGGISSDSNWEQKHWNQTATTVITYAHDSNGNVIAGGTVSTGTTIARAGAGCYTLGAGSAASASTGPSVTGAGGAATEGLDTWGGCEDHGGAQGKGDHGFVKQIVRPITY